MIGGHAIEDGVGAGGVVGHDAAHGRPVAAGRVGSELQAVGPQCEIQFVQDDARLNAYPALLRV